MSAAAKALGTKYVIAVVGATGNLGLPLTSFLAKEYKGSVLSRVLAVVRNPASEKAQALAAHGAELHKVDEARPLEGFLKALEGVDILVEITGEGTTNEFRDAMVDAAFQRGVKVFYPCEWGFDRRSEYWGWSWPLWVAKDVFNARVRARAKAEGNPLKIIEVAPGYFLSMIFPSPYFGFDQANSVYTVYGSPKQRVSFTHEDDIARSIVELSCRALNPVTAASVPDFVRIAGDTVSVEEAARIVEKVRGDGPKIEVKSEDLETHKIPTQQGLSSMSSHLDILRFLRVCMADNLADLSENNQNEVINPRQSVFTWKTVEEYSREKHL